jgi:hypothetical protein
MPGEMYRSSDQILAPGAKEKAEIHTSIVPSWHFSSERLPFRREPADIEGVSEFAGCFSPEMPGGAVSHL